MPASQRFDTHPRARTCLCVTAASVDTLVRRRRVAPRRLGAEEELVIPAELVGRPEAGAEERYPVAEHAFALRGIERPRLFRGQRLAAVPALCHRARVRGVVRASFADVCGDVPAADEVLELPQRLRGDVAPRVWRVDAELRDVRENALAHVVLLVEFLEGPEPRRRAVAVKESDRHVNQFLRLGVANLVEVASEGAVYQHELDATGRLAVERDRRLDVLHAPSELAAAVPLVRVVRGTIRLPVPLRVLVIPFPFPLLSCRDALVDKGHADLRAGGGCHRSKFLGQRRHTRTSLRPYPGQPTGLGAAVS